MAEPTNYNINDARTFPRLQIPAMYTLVRAKSVDSDRFNWTGHLYDISRSGMRFELDTALPMGHAIDVRVMLPGAPDETYFNARGTVVRIHDDDDEVLGPVRMGLHFTGFASHFDEMRLLDYLTQSGLRAAA